MTRGCSRDVNPHDPSILLTRRPDFPDTSPTGRNHLSARHDVCLTQGSVVRTIDALLGPWNSDGTDVTLQLPAPHTRQPRLLSTG